MTDGHPVPPWFLSPDADHEQRISEGREKREGPDAAEHRHRHDPAAPARQRDGHADDDHPDQLREHHPGERPVTGDECSADGRPLNEPRGRDGDVRRGHVRDDAEEEDAHRRGESGGHGWIVIRDRG